MLNKKNGSSGLSLLEICIALIVVGLLMIPIIQQYDQEIRDARHDKTRTNFLTVSTALQQYYSAQNRFPCPAYRTSAKTDPLYGRESPGVKCAGAAGDGTDIAPVAPTNVAKGDVPFKALGISDDATYDGWGNKIAYVISVAQTVAPITPGGAAITLRYKEKDPITFAIVTPPAKTVPYMLVSYGDDGLGAYNVNGQLVGACPTGGVNPDYFEKINCNDGAVFWQRDFVDAFDTNNANYDDDYIDSTSYIVGLDNNPWAYSPPNPGAGVNQFTNIFSADYVGVGTPNPTQALEVGSNALLASKPAVGPTPPIKGSGLSNSLCDKNGANCFTPVALGGSGMGVNTPNSANCPAGSGMTGIAGTDGGNPNPGFALCKPLALKVATQSCDPSTPYVVGFGAGGTIICKK